MLIVVGSTAAAFAVGRTIGTIGCSTDCWDDRCTKDVDRRSFDDESSRSQLIQHETPAIESEVDEGLLTLFN